MVDEEWIQLHTWATQVCDKQRITRHYLLQELMPSQHVCPLRMYLSCEGLLHPPSKKSGTLGKRLREVMKKAMHEDMVVEGDNGTLKDLQEWVNQWIEDEALCNNKGHHWILKVESMDEQLCTISVVSIGDEWREEMRDALQQYLHTKSNYALELHVCRSQSWYITTT